MACVVVRTSFRLHDNALLTGALADSTLSTIYIPIDEARVLPPQQCMPTIQKGKAITHPRFTLGQSKHRHAWGYHQYAFLLLTIRSFINDLRSHLNVQKKPHVQIELCKTTVDTHVINIVDRHNTIYIDRVHDPAWDLFDRNLVKYSASKKCHMHWVTTQTLLDWEDDKDCQTFLKTWRGNWRIPKSNQEFKDYVVARMREQTKKPKISKVRLTRNVGGRSHKRSKRKSRRASSAPPRLEHHANHLQSKQTQLNIDDEWKRWSSAMKQMGLRPYELVTERLEQYALKHLETTVAALSKPTWEKRLTDASLGIKDHASNPEKDTSKLSPFFALGVLSPKKAYERWHGLNEQTKKKNESVPSSAIAQLLWRETFHAASLLPQWWTIRKKDLSRKQRFWKFELQEAKPYGGWRVWTSNSKDPLYTGWLTATTGYHDLDESVLLLVMDGWIHHLRRHIIADYLTRGKAKADWMLGEQWFRQTLVDHDACVNRGNWMWLSGSDFSTALMYRHYGYKDYIKRHTYGTPVDNVGAYMKQSQKQQQGGGAPAQKDANRRGYYGGYADPRKRYDGHYKDPPVSPPETASVLSRRAKQPTRNPQTFCFQFDDAPNFTPDCAPYEILRMGAFGGTYFRDIWSGVCNSTVSGEKAISVLPKAWFKGIDKRTHVCSPTYDKNVNYFKATCGGSLDMWESSGWINPIDPFGWFQWYCHFFNGRRTSDDERQIKRWAQFTNPKGRFVQPLIKKCARLNTTLDDAKVSPVTRQNLLHWGRLRIHHHSL